MMAYGFRAPSALAYVDEHEPSWVSDTPLKPTHPLNQRRFSNSNLVTMIKGVMQLNNAASNYTTDPLRRASVAASVVTKADVGSANYPLTAARPLEVKSRPVKVQPISEEPATFRPPANAPSSWPKFPIFRSPPIRSSLPLLGSGLFSAAKDAREPCLEEKYGHSGQSLGFGSHAEVSVINGNVEGEGMLYAVKRFRKQRGTESNRDYKKRMYSEFCIGSTMRHENVINTIDLIRDQNDCFCIVMEYCSGGDLYAYLNNTIRERPKMDETHCFFKQLVDGVAYIHSIGVAHRDLKPENILITHAGHILKICDFGVADVFRMPQTSRLYESRGVCGSEPYIPPEEFDNPDAQYDATKADMWAVGVVFYMMLYGGMPWHHARRDDSKYRQYEKSVDPSLLYTQLSGYQAFDAQKDLGVRRVLYGLLNPTPSARPSANDIQSRTWLKNVSSCHVDNFSTLHFHMPIAAPKTRC